MSVTRPTLTAFPPLVVVVGVEAEVPPPLELLDPPQPAARRTRPTRARAGPRLIRSIVPGFREGQPTRVTRRSSDLPRESARAARRRARRARRLPRSRP